MVGRKRVTIKQVAREAGVSTQTVSRVLNNRPDVAPTTRRFVQEVIDRLGYRPSHVARSLIQGRSATLAIVAFGIEYFGPSRVISGVEKRATELDYIPLLSLLREPEGENIKQLLDTFSSRHVDGIVWAVPEIGANRGWIDEFLPQLRVPIAFVTMKAKSGLHTVSVDNYHGGLLATNHLLQKGKHDVCHISGPLDWWEARERKRGWQKAIREAGLDDGDQATCEGDWSASSGETGLNRLLESCPNMDAIFVGNDQMALGVLRAARLRGLSVPEELAVVGFDDIPEAAYFFPSLTTVNQPLYQLGCRAVDVLSAIIQAREGGGQALQTSPILLQPELIIRESSLNG